MVLAILVILAIAALLKYHYSNAGADELSWILVPTARLVEWCSGMSFLKEAGSGFVNRQQGLIIAPSCAGINFMIITFCMTAFSGLNRSTCNFERFLWGTGSLTFAYGYTIAVNSCRILLSIALYNANIYSSWLTPARVHRLEGIIVYLICLRVAWFATQKGLPLLLTSCRRPDTPDISDCWTTRSLFFGGSVPVFWYLAVTLGIPIVNSIRLDRQLPSTEHVFTVVSVCMVVFLLFFLVRLGCRHPRSMCCGTKEAAD